MMRNVHFLTITTINSMQGWIAPVELPSEESQDGVLVVPVFDGDRLFSQYQLEYTICRGSGKKYDTFHSTMDRLLDGSLMVVIEGESIQFVQHLVHGQPVLFDYIGQLSHVDFSCPLCQIEPEDSRTLDDLYNRKRIIIAGCESESEYGGFAAFIASAIGQKQFG